MLTVGLAQMNIAWENKKENLSRVRTYLELFLKLSGDKLILFPEMTLTGFSMNTNITAEEDDYTCGCFCELAREFQTAIGFGWVKKKTDGRLCENHYSIVSSDGNILSDYIKLHPFSYSGENDFFLGGDRLSLCEVSDFKVGTAICYDLRFPEIFQIMSDKAQLIVVPANWPEGRREHWITLLKARAIENQCYIAGVNCCGMADGRYYSGDSSMYAPKGQLLTATRVLRAGEFLDEEQLLIYELSNDVSIVRNEFPVKRDRRVDLYRLLDI